MNTQSHGAATPRTMPAIGHTGWLPGALGALLAILLTGWAGHLATSGNPDMPWLIAPMGASAVLIFVLPASPLSQPWPVMGGHLIAAITGLVCHVLIPVPWLAAALAVGAAIALMSLARCLHAPAGGTAVFAALANPTIVALGWHFLFLPVALNAALLIACGMAWHRLTRHSYPHRAAAIPAVPAWSGHIEDEDLDAVLEEWDEVLDVSREDLLALLHSVEARVRARKLR